ncbi:MAG TPA: MBL fold metallo-hydrolase [Armatimonadetes bacterium]|nr:MBL fold metallo-hydrolase [Armatimonadota bacterium]
MEIVVLGSGTSTGVPVIGCECEVCRSTHPKNKRTRPSLLLRAGERAVLIDAGPDFRQQALREGLWHLDAVVLTHAHADHLLGLDDLRVFNFRQQAPLPLYGSPATLATVQQMFAYAFEAPSEGSSIPQFVLHPIEGPFTVAGLPFLPLPVWHGEMEVLAFRVYDFAYVTDVSLIPARVVDQLKGLDLLILDALRYRPHPTHFSLTEALEVVATLRPRCTYLTHLTHHFDHETVNAQLPSGVKLAYDGLRLEIPS